MFYDDNIVLSKTKHLSDSYFQFYLKCEVYDSMHCKTLKTCSSSFYTTDKLTN